MKQAPQEKLTPEEAAAVVRALWTMSLPNADYKVLVSAIAKLERMARIAA